MTNPGLLLILLLTGIVMYLVWDTYYIGPMDRVTSTVDQKSYMVRDLPDKLEAANLLAQINQNMLKLIDHLKRLDDEDGRTKRLVKNYNPESFRESGEEGKQTSYSVNKGEKIVFCLRSRDEKKELIDLNTIMFVALHEMAHLATVSLGHTPEFWDNFRWLLEESVQIGIYVEQDFRKSPKPYCGITITDSPLLNK